MTTNVKWHYEQVWGVDVSKDWLDISIEGKVTRINQTNHHIQAFMKQHPGDEIPILVVLESTGGYEQLAVSNLVQAGYLVHIAHPNKVRHYAKVKGLLAKTDKLDACIIERYGRFIEPQDIHALMTEKELKLNGLSTRLHQLKLLHQQESCRLGRVTDQRIKKSHEALLALLAEQREAFETQLLTLIETDKALHQHYQLIRSMKGVGEVLGMTLIAELPELGKLTKKEIAALVGVAPMTQESGKYRGRAKTQCGRESIRRVLYMGALVAARHNDRYKHFYQKLLAKGKPKKVALVAVMRKMIVALNAMVQTNTPFKA